MANCVLFGVVFPFACFLGESIPGPTMFLDEPPIEKLTEYSEVFCSKRQDDFKLPDIMPVSQRKFKYHINSGKFSFNCQHNNQCY